MKRFLLWIGVVATLVAVLAAIYPGRRGGKTDGGGEEVLPGIKVEFTKEGDAGEYYARMIRSFLGRKSGDENPKTLTEDERKWFMLGTSCRNCNLYPEQFPHIMPYGGMPELNAAKDIGVIMAKDARGLWRKRRDREALNILRRVGVFGWHLEREKETLTSNRAGIRIQYVAYEYLARFYEARVKTEKVEEYRGYIEGRRKSLTELRELRSPEAWSDFERVKKIALSHEDPLWRKEACLEMTGPFVIKNRQARGQALQVLRTVAERDRDALVRQWASACIPYVLGTKKVP